MKILLSPRRLLLVALLFATGSIVLASHSKLETLGDNTYAITRTATNGFDRDVAKFRQEAQADAAKYCTEQGKSLKVITVTDRRPHFGGGYAWAKVVFQALDANDPALGTPDVAASNAGMAVAPTQLPTQAGDLYTEILKLDDLRKRGLLTDKEFESEKKKLLKNSK